MDYSELIKNISLTLASLTAVYGIDQWRREHRGKRQAELAEDTLTLFYEAKMQYTISETSLATAVRAPQESPEKMRPQKKKMPMIKHMLCLNALTRISSYLTKSMQPGTDSWRSSELRRLSPSMTYAR